MTCGGCAASRTAASCFACARTHPGSHRALQQGLALTSAHEAHVRPKTAKSLTQQAHGRLQAGTCKKGRGGWQACSRQACSSPHLQVLLLHVRGVQLVQHRLLDRPPDGRRVAAQLLREHARGALPARGQLAGDRAQHRLRVVRGHCARRHDMMVSIRMTRDHARPPRLTLHWPRLQAVGTESTLCSPHGSGSPQRVSAHTGTQEALCANAQQKEVLQQWRAAPPHACKQSCTDALAPVA